MWPLYCCRVCRLKLTFERQEGLSAVSDLRQGFFWLYKLYSLNELFTFLSEKSEALRITKNNMAAVNNKRLAKIWNPDNVRLQTEKPDAKGL